MVGAGDAGAGCICWTPPGGPDGAVPGQVSTCAQSRWALAGHLLALFPSPHHLHLGEEEKISKCEEDNKESILSDERFLSRIHLWKYKKYGAWDGGFVGCRITNCLSYFQGICPVSIYQISSPGGRKLSFLPRISACILLISAVGLEPAEWNLMGSEKLSLRCPSVLYTSSQMKVSLTSFCCLHKIFQLKHWHSSFVSQSTSLAQTSWLTGPAWLCDTWLCSWWHKREQVLLEWR